MSWKRVVIPILLFFYAVSTLYVTIGITAFNSPDENANYLTASLLSDFHAPVVYEQRNYLVEGIIVPRSMVAIGVNIVHVSFPGLPMIAGLLGAIHSAFIPLATILLVLASALLLKLAMQRYYTERIALIAATLYLLHPAMWYYAARPLMHNAGFVALLVIGVSVYTLSKKWWHVLFSGIALGLALAFRSYAAIWLIAPAAAFFLSELACGRRKILIALAGLVLGFLPVLGYNYIVYGGIFEAGYTSTYAFEPTLDTPSEALENEQSSPALSLLLPFGFHERVLLRNAWHYAFLLYPWAQGLIIAGLAAALFSWKKLKDGERWLLSAALYAWFVLILIYGSWVINDNPDPNAITLANSYTRYWLPAVAVSVPFAAVLLDRIVVTKAVAGAVILCYAALSGLLVFSGEDGLVRMRKNLQISEIIREQILEVTEEDAIIITEYADKYLFPHRSVLVPLRSEMTYAAVPVLLQESPLYYFGITLPEKDEEYLKKVLLKDEVDVRALFEIQNQTLYEFTAK